ncbi:MAG: hypothetical protein NC177_18400, partial [Ruminococcus flavefaciens]|nr:hypothetical protein [Ruminococcus flavefaciens]
SAKCIGDMMLAAADMLENAVKKLNYYANLKEQGRLIELPCKVGDTVYHYDEDFSTILPYSVSLMSVPYVDAPIQYEALCSNRDELLSAINFTINNIGKTVFLTRKEAEQALKERSEQQPWHNQKK